MSGLRKTTQPPHLGDVPVGVDGRRLVLTEQTSLWWVRTLAADPPGCWWPVLPMGARPRDRRWLLERLLDEEDPLDLDQVEELAEQVIGAVCGLNLWAAHRICQIVYGNWMMFDGWAASNGFDPLAAPIGRVLSAAYTWRMSYCEKKSDVNKVEMQVWGPPPMRMASGRPRDQAPVGWSDEAESSAFMAALGTVR